MQVTKPIIASFFIRSSGLLFGFILSIAISNYLGVVALGLYALFVVHLNIAIIFAKVGMDTLLLREGADCNPDARQRLLGIAWRKSLPTSLLTICLFFVLLFGIQTSLYEPLDHRYVIAAFSFALLGLVVHRLMLAYYRSGARTILANTLDGVTPNIFVLTLMSSAVLFLHTDAYSGAMPILLLASFYTLFGILSLIWLTSKSSILNVAEVPSVLSYKASAPFLLIGALTTINTSIDTLSISALMTTESLGIYNASLKISVLVSFPLVVAASVVSNQFARLHSQGDAATLTKLYRWVTLGVGSIAVLCFIVLIIVGEWLLSIWGKEFIEAYPFMLILSFGQVVNACFGPLGVLLSMTRRENVVLYVSLIGIIVNVILNYVLIRQFGLVGAACATAIAIILQNIGFWVGYKLSNGKTL